MEGKQQCISQVHAAAILHAVHCDHVAFQACFTEQRQWLLKEVTKMSRSNGAAAAAETMQAYSSTFDALGTCAPTHSTLENGECDGTKLLQGWHFQIMRKGHLLSEGRTDVGRLAAPTRVLVQSATTSRVGGVYGIRRMTGVWIKL